jgi:hypothetical protein
MAISESEEIVAPAKSELVIRPEVSIEEAKQLWDDYKGFREYILKDPNCYDEIEGSKEMNRTGATRLAVPFGLTIEERFVEAASIGDDQRFVVHVRVKKGARFVDGAGSCRLSEIPDKTRRGKEVLISQREHFAYSKAWTRAVKRAIADMLGGTEAEELVEEPPQSQNQLAKAKQSEGFKSSSPPMNDGQKAMAQQFLKEILGDDLITLVKIDDLHGKALVMLDRKFCAEHGSAFLSRMMKWGYDVQERTGGMFAELT